MDYWQNYKQAIDDLQHRLNRNGRLLELIISQAKEATKENDIMKLVLRRLASNTELQNLEQEISYPNEVAVTDGKPLLEDQAKKLKMEEFDVILNIPEQSLKVRKKQGRKFCLVICDLNALGPKRFALFEYMLEHPHITIGVHNIHQVHLYEEGILPNTLSKCIKDLRAVLSPTGPKGPYIVNTKVINRIRRSEQITGYGYKMSSNYKYLVILKKIYGS